jgi:hypothetical protein
MSMDIHVCWRGAFAPSRAALQGALKEVGFEATVLHDFPGDGGHWPIDIGEFKTGVEADADDDLDELVEAYPVLAAALDGRDKGVTFTFAGDPAEAGAALALAAAIAQLCDAVVYEPSEGVIYSMSRTVTEARNCFEEAKKKGYRARED